MRLSKRCLLLCLPSFVNYNFTNYLQIYTKKWWRGFFSDVFQFVYLLGYWRCCKRDQCYSMVAILAFLMLIKVHFKVCFWINLHYSMKFDFLKKICSFFIFRTWSFLKLLMARFSLFHFWNLATLCYRERLLKNLHFRHFAANAQTFPKLQLLIYTMLCNASRVLPPLIF